MSRIKRRGAGEEADHNPADHARAAVKRGKPRGGARETWKRVDREGEKQPAEKSDAEDDK